MIWKIVKGFVQGFVSDQINSGTVWGDTGKSVQGTSLNHDVWGNSPTDVQGNRMTDNVWGNNTDFYGNPKS